MDSNNLSKIQTRARLTKNNSQTGEASASKNKPVVPSSERKRKSVDGDVSINDVINIDTKLKQNLSSLHHSIKDVKEEMMSQNRNIITKMNDLTSKLSIIDELVAENILLRERINNLEKKIDNLESTKKLDVSEMNSIASEIEERSLRKNNVIVCNVEESSLAERSEIINDDRMKVYNFLKGADSSISLSDLRCFRLGKRNNKPRPIKVVLRSPIQVAEVMKNKMNLSSNHRIYRDQTVIQRNQYIQLKEELSIRTRKGERNLLIKFIKGCPKIVTSNNSKNSYATYKTCAE